MFLPAMYECSSFSAFSSTLDVISPFNFSQFNNYLILICTSQMINDIEHYFMRLFAIRISSLVKYLFKSFPYFLNGLFAFILVDFESFLEIFYLLYALKNIFFHSVAYLFILLTVCFKEQKLLILMEYHLSVCSFMGYVLVLYLRNVCPTAGHEGFLLCFLQTFYEFTFSFFF